MMIKISKSPNADSRTADHVVTHDELRENSVSHIRDVMRVMGWFGELIKERGHLHDITKIIFSEQFHFDFSNAQSMGMIEGLSEKPEFKKWHWFPDLHLLERHHLTDHCPDDVNLIDIIERMVDCICAGKARSGEIYPDTLSEEIILKAYRNTWDMIERNVEVE